MLKVRTNKQGMKYCGIKRYEATTTEESETIVRKNVSHSAKMFNLPRSRKLFAIDVECNDMHCYFLLGPSELSEFNKNMDRVTRCNKTQRDQSLGDE